jgi:hypothetical protein
MYLICLVWSLQSLLGVGYGHLNLFFKSRTEILLAFALMLASQFMMSLLIGLVINIVGKNLVVKNDRI